MCHDTEHTHTHTTVSSNHSPPDDRHTMLWLVEDICILMHKYISLWFLPYVSDTHRLLRTFEWARACFCSSFFCCYRLFVLWFCIIGVVVRCVICALSKEVGCESGKQSILIRINFDYQLNAHLRKLQTPIATYKMRLNPMVIVCAGSATSSQIEWLLHLLSHKLHFIEYIQHTINPTAN